MSINRGLFTQASLSAVRLSLFVVTVLTVVVSVLVAVTFVVVILFLCCASPTYSDWIIRLRRQLPAKVFVCIPIRRFRFCFGPLFLLFKGSVIVNQARRCRQRQRQRRQRRRRRQ